MSAAEAPHLSDCQIVEVLGLLEEADSVELKLTVGIPPGFNGKLVADLWLFPAVGQARIALGRVSEGVKRPYSGPASTSSLPRSHA